MFKAWLLRKEDGRFSATLSTLDERELPEGDVLLRVQHSTLNYKDALALSDKAPVVRKWPMVPGIDGAGVVLHSSHSAWKAGDRWILNGFGVGETHWGCLAERASLRGDWLVPLPPRFDTRQAMIIGTAGYTAMLCVLAIARHGVQAADGEVLVTGATGGVGSVALGLLAQRGYRVVAATGKPGEADYLRELGAAEIIDRAALSAPGKPLQKERWAAVIDTAGSHILANACAQTRWGGVVAACGLAQGMDFPTSVAPFILRNVTLVGVDSVMQPLAARRAAWDALAAEIDLARLERMAHDVSLDQVPQTAAGIMAGQSRGRAVVGL
ncbi:MAG: oxidoreductase [Betaproteobacteria bacterium]|nr:oxidoreductase [Betaproteobacteria bacterium]MDE2124176.1 oxidoreductase [Betaproteobacteria bacterium]MDE2186383.1 oxidoreductase [Betaproteobacteria bacterium]MDE2325970.1 oxidoreductase [Betaproteobacteria bacterium]